MKPVVSRLPFLIDRSILAAISPFHQPTLGHNSNQSSGTIKKIALHPGSGKSRFSKFKSYRLHSDYTKECKH